MPNSELVYNEIIDSHNHNCFDYLANIKDTPESLQQIFPELRTFFQSTNPVYDSSVSYANLYTSFLTTLEMNIENFESFFDSVQTAKSWLDQIFCNNNQILKKTFERFEKALLSRTLDELRPEKLISNTMKNYSPENVPHETTPAFEGSNLGRLLATLSNDFKPTHTTSISSTVDFRYTTTDSGKHNPSYPQQLRIGTQAQRHEGVERVSPLFRKWLELKTKVEPPNALHTLNIHHVYFNLLGYDRKDFEGLKEARMSKELEYLESNPNVVVITLPADKGLIDKSFYKKTDESKDDKSPQEFYEMINKIALGKKNDSLIQDFRVNLGAKIKLYGTKGEFSYCKSFEEKKIAELLTNSFTACGINLKEQKKEHISKAQQQAIWFHFCKFEFPNFVLECLKPKTWNVSCKDAIDRGGVASAYYNLMKSFEKNIPMSRKEFEQALHAAAALVKGRGLNHHYEIIWNAINYYVNANFDRLKSEDKQWLIHWRNDNTPYEIAQSYDYLAKILDQNEGLLRDIAQTNMTQKARQILTMVRKDLFDDNQNPKPISGKRLFLEVVSQITQATTLEFPEQPKKNLENVLNKLQQQSIFKPLCKLLKNFIDLIVKYFPQLSQLKGKNYSSLVRHSDERETVTKIKKNLQEMKKGSEDLENINNETDITPGLRN